MVEGLWERLVRLEFHLESDQNISFDNGSKPADDYE